MADLVGGALVYDQLITRGLRKAHARRQGKEIAKEDIVCSYLRDTCTSLPDCRLQTSIPLPFCLYT